MKLSEFGVEFYPTYEFGTAYRQTQGGLSKRPPEEHLATIEEIRAIYWKKLSFLQKIEYVSIKGIGKIKRIVKKILHI